jgi:hypothetical protein
MYPEQLDTILPLELSLLLNKLSLLLLAQSPTVLCQQIIVLPGTLWRNAFINQLLNFLVNEQRVGRLLFLPGLDCRLDLVNETFELNRAVVLNVSRVLVDDEDLSQTLPAVC